MNTAELLDEVTRRGIKLKPDGDALCYTAPKDVLTSELMAKLKAHKTELLDILRKPGAEVLAQAIQIRRIREQGEIPPHYTAVTVCVYCGPVPIFAGVAERVLGCPWCFNRLAGRPVPRMTTVTNASTGWTR